MKEFGRSSWIALKWILIYLKGNKNLGILFKKVDSGNGDPLIGYCDLDFATNLDNRKSQTGYIYKLYGAAESWKSTLQSVVALSTTEAEYIALTEAVKKKSVVVVPECSPELKPVVGQKFQSLAFTFTFYDVYARVVGFDTCKQGMRKADDVTTWYYLVCNREGKKKSKEDDQLNAQSGFSMKRRRLSKRCGCKMSISFKFSPKEEFQKFILDCSKANIGPTLTFKVLKEILGGFDLVGCTVGDIRNASRDIKAYAYGFDVQMVLDDMAKKKEMSEAFTYHYEVNATNQLVALFWCDCMMKRNYHMFGDIVAFDSTYNTNRYCMIFTPFTGKNNHGRPVTFAAGLVCNEKTRAFAWLFRHFVECMGVAPKMIVTDQDLGMRSAIEEVLVGTRHGWCMWHIMHKLATKVPNRLLRAEDFKKEFNACVWTDLLEDVDWFNTFFPQHDFGEEPDEVDVVKMWVMNMKVEAGKAAPYSGAMDCAVNMIKAFGATKDLFQPFRGRALSPLF
ncbi:protein FAR1-RELATED SEQUENCE 5-like [Salvia splendens]|uniref:protein FAR1-RELATED SEQUENCE 5-like n=1 Tax=Salvia splendens TaxID=180675 RepID=UPI001C27234D|nr:protein FAR1-RELATED SEQUENCE 5-like [Salvia splendens]